MQRRKPHADEHGAANRHRGAAAARAFQQRAEREGDEQHLQAPVARNAADRLLDDLELLGFHGDVVHENGRHQDPGDAQPAVHQPIGHRPHHHVDRHMEDRQGDDNPDGERIDGGQPGGRAAHRQEVKESADRDRGRNGGQHLVAQRVKILLPDLIHRMAA